LGVVGVLAIEDETGQGNEDEEVGTDVSFERDE
jgi:hypothetical protein